MIGRPDPQWGEAVVAFVVRGAGPALRAEELDAHCLASIARFKRPKEYRFVDALPKNNYGKVLKTELRARLARERAEGDRQRHMRCGGYTAGEYELVPLVQGICSRSRPGSGATAPRPTRRPRSSRSSYASATSRIGLDFLGRYTMGFYDIGGAAPAVYDPSAGACS